MVTRVRVYAGSMGKKWWEEATRLSDQANCMNGWNPQPVIYRWLYVDAGTTAGLSGESMMVELNYVDGATAIGGIQAYDFGFRAKASERVLFR